MQLLEGQLKAARDANEMQIEQLNAQLQREQLERSMAEGALESGRKDIARLMREIGALQYRPVAPTPANRRRRSRTACEARRNARRCIHRRRREKFRRRFFVRRSRAFS